MPPRLRRVTAPDRPARLPRWRELDRQQRRHYTWWGVLFFAVGVLATASVLLALFSPFGQRADRLYATARPPAGVDARVLVPGSITDAEPVRWAGQAHYFDEPF